MLLDARRSLQTLHDEWEACRRCPLGVHREDVGGAYVAGIGPSRGIMFIGEGPGKQEEKEGIPFVGRSGKLLRKVLIKLNIFDVSYITNIVSCRSCEPVLDDAGDVVVYRGEVNYKDKPPPQAATEACLPRLFEEMYIVDPLIVVLLGAPASSTLLRRPVTISRDAGKEEHIFIPGVTQLPVRTEKKGLWVHKVRGVLVAPTERNKVRYLAVPTFHPAHVVRAGADCSDSSPLRRFFKNVKDAALTYVRMAEYYGLTLTTEINQDVQVEDIRDELYTAGDD